MKLISASEVEANLGMADCIGLMKQAMIAASGGQTTQLVRQFMPIPGQKGKMAMMPGSIAEPPCFGIKLVCKYQRPANDPLGTHVGMVLLFDSEKGIPLAMVEGSSLTGIRTAAASGMATDLLARKDAARLAMIGTGEQARRHVAAMCAVRPIRQLSVWGRTRDKAEAFAASMAEQHGIEAICAPSAAEAVPLADIICTTTSAPEPVLSGADLSAGQHINLVGSAIPSTAEVDDNAVAKGRYVVDSRESAMAAAGELLGAIERGVVTADHIAAEIGEIASERAEGRQSDDQITIYKSLGISAQDLFSASYLWRKSGEEGFGQEFDLMA